MTGEKTSEEQMTAVVEAVSKAANCRIDHWAVQVCLDDFPYHYLLLLENQDGKDLAPFSALADETLGEVNLRYRFFTQENYMGRLAIRNQAPGTHAAWDQRRHGNSAADYQNKPLHVLDTEEKEQFLLGRLC